MSFTVLAVICLVGLLGPLLALPQRWHLPVVLGELAAGVLLGQTGLGFLDPGDETFTFLADIGFALVMFVAGTHVPVRDRRLRPALRIGVQSGGGGRCGGGRARPTPSQRWSARRTPRSTPY